ncbi:hypothetical protein MTR67_000870 [Solanum verrucosum]|uniref:Uncharacterized protein n=1 Tax=Solanum verrucosum TaxID=315347 RepID=A0AAF0PQR9_SOLVR|nr:hypothetical protein MTR67_000870 [Solanum verrucosum]
MNSQIKPQVQTTSTRMQHNVDLFLSSELRHSPKRSIKLLGHELRIDFHHNQTTPLSEGMWFFFLGLLVSVSHPKHFHFHLRQLSNLSDNTPRALEIMSV